MMKKLLMTFYVFITMKVFAWYPDYTVMITDFVLPYDFLKPMSLQSVNLKAMGEHFLYFYGSPVDDIFQNPAYLSLNKRQYIYFDIAGENIDRKQESIVLPMYPNYNINSTFIDVMPYYWSPYRYINEPAENEPLITLFYTRKFGGKSKPIGFGFSFEYFYDQLKFYQPYWYWYGWRGRDSFGVAYDSEMADPYQDYRLVEYGDNKLTSDGYRINTFLSYDLTKSLSTGFRYGILRKYSDGNYTDLDKRTDSGWYDEYLNYNEIVINQDQNYSMSDFSFGLLWKNTKESNLGINIGYSLGEINRDYLEIDTTNYSSYKFVGPDTNNYRDYKNHSSSLSDKEWDYNGHTLYGNLHGNYKLNKDVIIKWSIYSENRNADLIMEELMNRHSYNKYYYYSTWDSTIWKSSNISYARIDRSGSGEYSFKQNRFSIGADWIVSSKLRFIGGLVIDRRSDNKNADEPLIGRKYSLYERLYNSEFSSSSMEQNDDKRFFWHRNEQYRTVAVPTGLIFQAGEHVELQLGVTKIFEQVDIDEGYDLIVYHETVTQTENGITTTTSDSAYVESHTFPGTHNFNSMFLLNAGVSIKYHDRVRITCAIKESLFKPSYFKIGAEFSF